MALYAFDGTWNRRDSKDGVEESNPAFRRDTDETNVHRFAEFFGQDRTEYLEGVGTRFSKIGAAIGGGFGAGGRHRLRRMYLALCKRYHEGDHDIDVIGFSRGAALAVHFTNVIARYGIVDPGGPRHLGYHRYEGLGWTFGFPKLTDTTPDAVPVRFLGLWDTVATFGVPVGPLRNKSPEWWVHSLPPNVTHGFHAMALDEVRSTFELVRPKEASANQIYELWFRGVHSNVGGSYHDRGLSDIALAWMMEMYLWTLDYEGATGKASDDFVHALRMIGPERSAAPATWSGRSLEALVPDPDGELGLPFARDREAWRPLPDGAKVHHSAALRTKNLVIDHYQANRRLLRRVPPDTIRVFDPPIFYKDTPEQAARRVGEEAFGNLPVRTAPWCSVRKAFPVRSDEWWAPAPRLEARREELVINFSKTSFVDVAAAWLQSGKPPAATLRVPDLTDANGKAVDKLEAAAWIVDTLLFLETYVPALRDYRPYPPPPAVTPGGTEGPPPDDRRLYRRPDPDPQ